MSEKVKVKLYSCKWFEADIDDLSKNYWCRNPECPTRECWCETSIENDVCPGFEKKEDNKATILEYDKKTIDNIKNEFIKKIREICLEKYSRNESDINIALNNRRILSGCITYLDKFKESSS